MAVKFSQFTSGSTVGDIDFLVGYKASDNVQIPIGLVSANTTYGISTSQSGDNVNVTLTGSDSTTDSVLITKGSNITLTEDGAGNGFTIASTAAGDTYELKAGAKAGSSVPLQLDALSGSDSSVNLTEGSGITLTQTSGTEITIASSGGGFGSINQFTGTGSSLGALALNSTPTAAQNCIVSISGVTQNLLDASDNPNWSVSGSNLTFAFNPPVTAANGIQIIVIS
jgi:hypothetical protein